MNRQSLFLYAVIIIFFATGLLMTADTAQGVLQSSGDRTKPSQLVSANTSRENSAASSPSSVAAKAEGKTTLRFVSKSAGANQNTNPGPSAKIAAKPGASVQTQAPRAFSADSREYMDIFLDADPRLINPNVNPPFLKKVVTSDVDPYRQALVINYGNINSAPARSTASVRTKAPVNSEG